MIQKMRPEIKKRKIEYLNRMKGLDGEIADSDVKVVEGRGQDVVNDILKEQGLIGEKEGTVVYDRIAKMESHQ